LCASRRLSRRSVTTLKAEPAMHRRTSRALGGLSRDSRLTLNSRPTLDHRVLPLVEHHTAHEDVPEQVGGSKLMWSSRA